jgi:2-enoate reductase
MKTNEFAKLFEPVRIGDLEIPNRIAMAPMGTGSLMTDEGGFSQRAIDYHVERAKGGTGLIITGLFKVENEIEKFKKHHPSCIMHNPAHFISTGTELTETVHAYGSKIFIQLTAGFGRSAFPSRVLAVQPVAPSPIPNYWEPSITCRELKTEEVDQIVKSFAAAAELAITAGFDGIEIHAVHEGYLLDQFTIAMFNKRTDKYGGDLRGRLTFPIEILETIKNRVGKKYPVILRFSIKSYVKDWGQGGLPGEDFKEKGRDTDEGLEAARILEKAGYDALNADAGTYDAWYWAHPPLYQEHGCYLPLVEKLKKTVRIPVMVAGRMELPELAEKTLADGKADIIVLGRGLLAEPFWAAKVKQGKTRNIRPCLACHDGCFLRMLSEKPISCAVNPACGREALFSIQPAGKRKRVMVIGGGVAGMEAARVAALRGHSVTLFEKNSSPGGHLIAASVPPFKQDDKRLLEWYLNELKELHVTIKNNTTVTPETVKDQKPDTVVIATGSTPVIPDIPGISNPKVTTAIELLLGKKQAGNSVVVAGGGLVGCETALWLAQQGKKVTIVEMLGSLMCSGLPVHHANMTMLIDLLNYNRVTILTNTVLTEITGSGAEVIQDGSKKNSITADTIVIAVGLKSYETLYHAVYGLADETYVIGDAQKARKIMHAIWDANEVARHI